MKMTSVQYVLHDERT